MAAFASRRTGAILLALACALGAPLPAAAGSTADGMEPMATDLLPDLVMAPLFDLSLRESARGHLQLRFGSTIWNLGRGPLEVRARDRSHRTMRVVDQLIATSSGVPRRVRHPKVFAFYTGDGHDHWHLPGFVVVTLVALPTPANPAPTETRRLRKIGFCLTDVARVPAEVQPPGSAPTRQYPWTGCGRRGSTHVKMGIAVGWADVYRPGLAHQLIHVTGLSAANYRLCAIANPEAEWNEANYLNNSTWTDIHLDPAAMTVTEIGRGDGACPVTAT